MISFYISESFRLIKSAKGASILTVFTLALAIIFCSVSLSMVILSGKIDAKLKSRIEAEAFLCDTLNSTQISLVENRIRKEKMVSDVSFVSKDKGAEKFISQSGVDYRILLKNNPIPNSFKIHFNSRVDKNGMNQLLKKIKGIVGVEDVVYDNDLVIILLEMIRSSQIAIIVLSIALLGIAMYLLYTTSKIFILNKRVLYETMKLVGGRLATIKIPLLIAGVTMGLTAGIICVILFNSSLAIFRRIYFDIQLGYFYYFYNIILLSFGMLFGPIGCGLFAKTLSLRIDQK